MLHSQCIHKDTCASCSQSVCGDCENYSNYKHWTAQLAAANAEIERLKKDFVAVTLALETENQAATAYAKQVAHWIDKHDKLLAAQSSTIELRKEIARLETTIQGLVAEREERERQEPVGLFARYDVGRYRQVYEDGTNEGEELHKLYARPVHAVPEGWQIVYDGDSLAMLQYKDGRIFRLQQLGAGVNDSWGVPDDNDSLVAMLAAAPQNGKEKA